MARSATNKRAKNKVGRTRPTLRRTPKKASRTTARKSTSIMRGMDAGASP